jgi:dCMP deaminase
MDITINPNRIELDEAYMQMAEVWAQRSKANRLQVGALIVKDRQIISDGYNGMPSGVADDTCEYFANGVDDAQGLRTKPEVLHAESNALMKIAENGGVGAQGATLYTTYSPCPECAKLIKQAKIARVVYRNSYRLPDGILMLRKLGVRVDHLPYGDEPELPASAPRIESPQAQRTGALNDVDWPVHPKPAIPSRGEDPQVSRLLREVAQQRAPQPAPKPAPPPPPPQSTMSDDEEVQRLLREFEAHQAAQAKAAPAVAPNGKPVAPPEAPYRSSFL